MDDTAVGVGVGIVLLVGVSVGILLFVYVFAIGPKWWRRIVYAFWWMQALARLDDIKDLLEQLTAQACFKP
jgi:hypothetical protein